MPNPAPIESAEYQKMVSGKQYYIIPLTRSLTEGRYVASDPVLAEARLNAKRLCRKLNDSIGDPDDLGARGLARYRAGIIDSLFSSCDKKAIEVEPPFWCDYGCNLSVGTGFYCNYNCTILGSHPLAKVYNA